MLLVIRLCHFIFTNIILCRTDELVIDSSNNTNSLVITGTNYTDILEALDNGIKGLY